MLGQARTKVDRRHVRSKREADERIRRMSGLSRERSIML